MVLFEQRARAVDPSFRLDATTAPGVAEVVTRLDGLPLAIELAAPRLRTLSLAQLRRRLDPALPVLTGGPVDRPGRQRTLRAAIAWSENLLAPGQQALLARLAVFRGGVTPEAAEVVAAGTPVTDAAAGLDTLVEASLLQRPDEGSPDRFTMLATIRDDARERLVAAGEHDRTARRHLEFFARLVEQAEPRLTGTDQAVWLRRLDDEHPNLRAALSWAHQAGHLDAALDMAGRMWRFWQLQGYFVEGRRWLEDLLQARPAPGPARARAPIGLASICYWQFDLDTAEAAYEEAIALARDLDEWWLEFEGLLGLVATIPGDLEGAREYGEQVLAGARAAGERWYETQTLRTLGLVSLLDDQPCRAEDELVQSLEIAHEIEDPVGLAMDLDRLGQAAVARGHFERAVVLAGAADRLRESVTGGRTLDDFRWKRRHPREAARSVPRGTDRGRLGARAQHEPAGRHREHPPSITGPPSESLTRAWPLRGWIVLVEGEDVVGVIRGLECPSRSSVGRAGPWRRCPGRGALRGSGTVVRSSGAWSAPVTAERSDLQTSTNGQNTPCAPQALPGRLHRSEVTEARAGLLAAGGPREAG